MVRGLFVIALPGYEISGEFTGLGEVTATIKRADQSGSGLNGVLKVEFGGVELVSGEDYKLYAAGGEIKVELTAPETFGSIVVGSVTFTVPAEEVTEETV